MNRSILVATFVAIVTMLPGSRVEPARAESATDADLWSAAGVTQLTDRTEAPPVVLNDLAGQRVDLKDLRGRLVMLYFWATW